MTDYSQTVDLSRAKPFSKMMSEIDESSIPDDLKEAARKRLKDQVTDRSGLTVEQKLRLAHDKVFKMHPIALAAVAARWKTFFTEVTRDGQSVRTMATDGRNLFVSPTWAKTLPLGMTACIVLHEVCHVVLQHHFRMGKMPKTDRELANIAADLAINSRCLPEYLRLASEAEVGVFLDFGCFPRFGRFSHLPELKSFEWYLTELKKERDQNGGNSVKPPQGFSPMFDEGTSDREEDEGAGGSYGDDEEDDEDDEDEEDSDEGSGSKHRDAIDDGSEIPDNLDEIIDEIIDRAKPDDEKGEGEGKGNGGPGEGGQADTGIGSGGDPSDDGSFRPGVDNIFGSVEPFSEDEEELHDGERAFQEAVTAAIVTDKGWGMGSGWLETTLSEDVMPTDPDAPKLNWKQMLRDFLSKVCPEGYSYSRPSRRHGHRKDIILPAHRSLGTANGLLIVDTSGSMGDAECDAALRELEAILSEYPKATVRVVSCDARVILEDAKVYTRDDFPLTEPKVWKGRGGTNLSPAFTYAQELGGEIDWVVCLTDMEWYYQYAPNPGKPVIWLSTRGDARHYDETIPFGVHAQVVI